MVIEQTMDTSWFGKHLSELKLKNELVSTVAKHTLSVREGWVRFPGPSNRQSVANDSPLLRCFFGAALLSREEGAGHSLHASAQYREHEKELIFSNE